MTDYHLIDINGLCKNFDGTEALHNINLFIRKNEFVTLLGPSGCGKTTLLRCIAGFISPDSGDIKFDGRSILSLPSYKRRVNTVFQRYALFPHMNVFDNVAFGLTIRKKDKAYIREQVPRMLSVVGLAGYEKRWPDSLSGGQQQRVAIARALINEPEVLLLDEPLGALDLKFRKEMQLELKRMQIETGITFIYVTHDQEEALTMSDTVVVMNHGVIQQIGKPKDVYDEPKNAFVADFIGESNIIPGVMREDYLVDFAGHTFKCVDSGFGTGEEIDVVVRPEDVKLSVDRGELSGIIDSAIFMGVHYEYRIGCSDHAWKRIARRATLDPLTGHSTPSRGAMVRECVRRTWLAQTTEYYPAGSAVRMSVAPDMIHIMKKSAAVTANEA